MNQMEKYNIPSVKGLAHVKKYRFVEYIKTITEVLHVLDPNPDLNSVECLHLPFTFFCSRRGRNDYKYQ